MTQRIGLAIWRPDASPATIPGEGWVYLQLHAIIADLHATERRLHALRARLPADVWNRRPAAGRWSPAECVAHLNLTSEAFLPLLRPALDDARRLSRGRMSSARYRRDVLGWMIWRMVAPNGRFRTKTAAAFVPSADRPIDVLVADYERLQRELAALVRSADGLPIDRVKVQSPFDARAKYNIYAALTILPRHQHRHLHQAEDAAGVTGVSDAGAAPL